MNVRVCICCAFVLAAGAACILVVCLSADNESASSHDVPSLGTSRHNKTAATQRGVRSVDLAGDWRSVASNGKLFVEARRQGHTALSVDVFFLNVGSEPLHTPKWLMDLRTDRTDVLEIYVQSSDGSWALTPKQANHRHVWNLATQIPFDKGRFLFGERTATLVKPGERIHVSHFSVPVTKEHGYSVWCKLWMPTAMRSDLSGNAVVLCSNTEHVEPGRGGEKR